MGLFSALNASVSGMAAQTNTLTSISQNISNSDTTGYKEVEAQFEDVVSSADQNSFNGAGVTTTYAYLNSVQGGYQSTNTTTNLAIQGNGFFVVQNSATPPEQFLTRDGSFVPDASGNLVNDAGYTLVGFPSSYEGPTSLNNMVPVNVNGSAAQPTPTTLATLSANLPSTAAIDTGTPPSTNTAASTYTEKTSLVTYNDLGTPVTLDIYYTNLGTDGSGNPTWEMDVYNDADSSSGGFPYSSAALATQTLTFSPTTGDLTSTTGTGTNASAIPITLPGASGQTFDLNISGTTQTASAFGLTTHTANGSAGSTATGAVNISSSGVVSAVYADGTDEPVSSIYLVTVPSPDGLTPVSGNVWQMNSAAGAAVPGVPGSSGTGTIQSSTLESSTVDLATQLTNMIQAQNGYEANSKVFETGTTLLEDLVNLIK